MISLLRAELRRFTSRRLMRVLAVVGLGLLLVILARVGQLSHRELTPAEQRQAQVMEGMVQQCEAEQAAGQVPSEVNCRDIVGSPDPRLYSRSTLPGTTRSVAIAVAMFAFIAAASFVGADWGAGTMQSLLFWEPRRGRVLFAKAVAVVAGSVGFLLVMEAVAYAGIMLIAATRGSTEGTTAGLHLSNLLTIGRAALFVGIVALFAYAIAGLARITAAALAAAFVYFAVIENVLMFLRPGWERYLLTRNVFAVLMKQVYVQPATRDSGGDFFFDTHELYRLTGTRGAITLAVYLAILLGAYYLAFTRRDVT